MCVVCDAQYESNVSCVVLLCALSFVCVSIASSHVSLVSSLQATACRTEDIKRDLEKIGDLGIVAARKRERQTLLYKPAPLNVRKVCVCVCICMCCMNLIFLSLLFSSLLFSSLSLCICLCLCLSACLSISGSQSIGGDCAGIWIPVSKGMCVNV